PRPICQQIVEWVAGEGAAAEDEHLGVARISHRAVPLPCQEERDDQAHPVAIGRAALVERGGAHTGAAQAAQEEPEAQPYRDEEPQPLAHRRHLPQQAGARAAPRVAAARIMALRPYTVNRPTSVVRRAPAPCTGGTGASPARVSCARHRADGARRLCTY